VDAICLYDSPTELADISLIFGDDGHQGSKHDWRQTSDSGLCLFSELQAIDELACVQYIQRIAPTYFGFV